MQYLTTVLTDDQDTKHNNSTNRGSGYKKKTKVLSDDQDTTPNNSTNR